MVTYGGLIKSIRIVGDNKLYQWKKEKYKALIKNIVFFNKLNVYKTL